MRLMPPMRIIAVIMVLICPLGCETRQPAAATNEQLAEQDALYKDVLTDAERREIIRTFQTLAEDYRSTNPPTTGPPRGRWSDVPAAAKAAARETEMAVRRREELDHGYVFHLVTIEKFPGELRVERAPGEQIWTARARIGLFNEYDGRARELLDAFEQHMRRLSAKPKFTDR